VNQGKGKRWGLGLAAGALGLLAFGVAGFALAQTKAPAKADDRAALTAYIDAIARKDLAERTKTVAAISDKAGAEARKAYDRKTILDLIGGLPPRVPLNAKSYGTVQGDGFTVERVMYESQKGFKVTAAVYIPKGKGPFPAVLVTPGHGANGKIANRTSAGLLARAGIMAMTWDLTGMGERLQYYDPDLEVSRVGAATSEHSMEFWQTQPVGGHVARYFIRDAMAGLDYLSSRKDVDKTKLAALGCSGGGTVTAYLAALEDRLKAVGTACYITTIDQLWIKQGPQDAEQSIPGFVSHGLDLPDWVEAAAPKPYAIISTTEDMFPYAGAQTAYNEAKRFYGLMGAEDKITWITGPGPHGNLGPIYDQIVAFYTKWLKNDPARRPTDPVNLPSDEDLTMTRTGQIMTSIPGAVDFQQVNARYAATVIKPHPMVKTAAQATALRTRLKSDIQSLLHTTVMPGGAPPAVRVVSTSEKDGVRLQTLRLRMADGLETDGLYAAPVASGRHPATLVLTKDQPNTALTNQVTGLAKAGRAALALTATGAGPEGPLKGSLLGDWNLMALRLMAVDKTPLGMRLDDAVQAMDWLSAQGEVDPKAITAYGLGVGGPLALHLAVIDDRVAGVITDGSLLTYRMAVDQPIQKLLPDVLPQGVLRHYDLGDLILAAAPRPVTLANAEDAVGQPLFPRQIKAALSYVNQADAALGAPNRLKLAERGARDPLFVQ
jgi:dienelactone hydrolase